VTPDELQAGERVRILPGERVPADGVIALGSTEVDESLLTGEWRRGHAPWVTPCSQEH